MTTDISGAAKKIDKLADSITGRALRQAVNKAGAKGKTIANEAVRSDLGDMSMSNWRRGRPIQISTRYDLVGDHSVEFKPNGRAAGPMRVLQDGRRAGVSRGTRRRSPRPVSASSGKGTWSDATQQMEKELPAVVHDEVVKVLGKMFGR